MNKNHTTHYRFKALLAFCILFISGTKSYAQADDFDRIQKVVASDRAADETFGYRVSIIGDLAAVGCPYINLDENGSNFMSAAGAVYILKRNTSGNWIEIAKLTAPNRAAGNQFGNDIELSGNKLIVGQPGDDLDVNESNSITDAGSALIFEQDGSGNWLFTQKICATIRSASDNFGYNVSISNDRAIISAPYNATDVNNANYLAAAGAVFAFEKNSSGVWTQQLKIVEPIRDVNNMFGKSIDISDNYFVIGSPYNNTDASNLNNISSAGAVYVYAWNPTSIALFHKTVAVDRKFSAEFGTSVVIEGSIMAVGARGESADANNLNPINYAGAVYVFNLAITPFPAFHFYQKMVAPDRGVDTQLGREIDMKDNFIIAGSYNNYDNTLTSSNFVDGSGSAYIFKRTTNYSFLKKLTARQRSYNDYFGQSVAISSNTDGMVALVNCNYDQEDENDQNPLSYTGSVFFFDACIPSSNTISVSACNNYEFHGSYYASSGTYIDTIPNAIGCDSVVTINLTIVPIDTTLSSVNGDLVCNQANATYQWYNCQNNTLVNGATNQVFSPTVNGIYYVVISSSNGSCSDTSACAFVNNVGLEELQNQQFKVYPNPSSDNITISGETTMKSLEIIDLNGVIVRTHDFSTTSVNSINIDVNNFTKGLYFILITSTDGQKETLKVAVN